MGPESTRLIFPSSSRSSTAAKKGARTGKGKGMGLAIARAILIAHHGSIEVSSHSGQGTNIRFWVPLNETSKTDSFAIIECP
ncbi:MAG: ATP-binding protein [Acidobacteriota bacterium]|nr:ATP-binding protein [Acidobacteriota bacterium]